MDTIVNRLTETNNWESTIWLLRRGIYLFLLYNTLILLPIADDVWGEAQYLLKPSIFSGPIYDTISILSSNRKSEWYVFFIVGQLISLVFGLAGILPRLCAVLVYFFTANMLFNAITIGNGGHGLISILLFFMIFMKEKSDNRTASSYWKILGNWASNIALICCRLQVAVVYLVASVLKLTGELWLKGEGAFYVLATEEFSHPWAVNALDGAETTLLIMGYFALIYQIAFPLLIWFRKTRGSMIVLGTIFHLAIAFINGITDFGLIMIASYFAFYTNARSVKIKMKIINLNNTILGRFRLLIAH